MFVHLLSVVVALPFFGTFVVSIVPRQNRDFLRLVGLSFSLITFVVSVFLWVLFDSSVGKFQFVENFFWVKNVNLCFSLGVDGISLFFILLTTFLVPLCLLSAWESPNFQVKEYFMCFLLIEGFILVVFSVLDLLVFYVFFESVLIPMFLIIGIWGSRERKIRAGYMFFLYTLLGSVLMLLGLLLIYFESGTTDYQVLLHSHFSVNQQYLLWLAFFASFAAKVPIVPVHIWLPEAHVEAPTGGSVLLAGVLLKLGTYGLVRFSFPLFPVASVYFTPLVYTLAVIAIVYTSLTAIRQTDVKRIIAYASVAHINLTLVGLFSLTAQGVEGSILQILSHGLVSGALFLCVGVLYDRYHSRLVRYYSGVAHSMPLYVTVFLFFTIANIGLPCTSSFIGEFIILLGVYQVNTFVAILSSSGMVLGAAYSLWLFNRISYGNLKTCYVGFSNDLSRREFYVFVPLIFLTLVIGVYPDVFLVPLHVSCQNLINHVCLYKGF